ncbi:MAG: YidB family protein [Janthinobacterium lividum]
MSDLLNQFLAPQFLASVGQALGLAQGLAGGGLPALLAMLENAGLAERVRSWVGPEDNLPVTPAELSAVFTPAQVETAARQAGVSPEILLAHLAERLPHEVDQATRAKAAGAPADDLPGA